MPFLRGTRYAVAAAGGGNAAPSTLLTGLVAYYKCEESSGALVDALGAYSLTAFNSPGSAAGIVGNARTLTVAGSQYFSGSVAFDLAAQWTLDGWAVVDDFGDYRVLVAADNTSVFHMYTFPTSGDLKWQGPAAELATASGVSAGVGFYWRVDYDAGSVSLSINNGTPGAASVVSSAVSSNLELGARGGGTYPMGGKIDEIGYWNRLLTSDEKAARYNGGALTTHPFA